MIPMSRIREHGRGALPITKVEEIANKADLTAAAPRPVVRHKNGEILVCANRAKAPADREVLLLVDRGRVESRRGQVTSTLLKVVPIFLPCCFGKATHEPWPLVQYTYCSGAEKTCEHLPLC
jgi:hypothetical protein